MSSPSPSSNGKPHNEHRDDLNKIQTAASIPISPELFEQLYLSPKNKVKGELRQKFGNPTPVGKEDCNCSKSWTSLTQ